MSVLVQSLGLLVILVAALVVAAPLPPARVLAWGGAAGAGGALGNAALYRGLAASAMNVVAPLSALMAATLPAVVGLASGDSLTVAAGVGLVVALTATVLVSVRSPKRGEPSSGDRRVRRLVVRAGAASGLTSGLGFGFLFIGLAEAGPHHGVWPVVACQAVAAAAVLALQGPLTGVLRQPPPADPATSGRSVWRRAIPWAVPAATAGMASDLLFLAATGRGELAVVAVITSLYPAVTVVLAATLLRERATALQLAGLVLTAVALALITG